MNSNNAIARFAAPPFAMLRRVCQTGDRHRSRLSIGGLAATRPSRLSPGLMNCLLCTSLWLSLILAIWMGRGWIALFFSGQLLCAGASVAKKLALRTQCVLAECNRSPARWNRHRHAR
jgi:hypothetical protein